MYCALSAGRPVLMKAALNTLILNTVFCVSVKALYFVYQCPQLCGPCFLEFLVPLSILQYSTTLGINSREIC